jgi:hypothetical protein
LCHLRFILHAEGVNDGDSNISTQWSLIKFIVTCLKFSVCPVLSFFQHFYQYMIVTSGVLLSHFHIYMFYTLIWFIPSIILPSTPFPVLHFNAVFPSRSVTNYSITGSQSKLPSHYIENMPSPLFTSYCPTSPASATPFIHLEIDLSGFLLLSHSLVPTLHSVLAPYAGSTLPFTSHISLGNDLISLCLEQSRNNNSNVLARLCENQIVNACKTPRTKI